MSCLKGLSLYQLELGNEDGAQLVSMINLFQLSIHSNDEKTLSPVLYKGDEDSSRGHSQRSLIKTSTWMIAVRIFQLFGERKWPTTL